MNNILFIGAHADDLELSCGGTIRRFVKENKNVKIIIVSVSGYRDLYGRISRTVEDNVSEALSGLKTLGVQQDNVIMLNYETTKIPYSVELIRDIERIIVENDIQHVFTHYYFDTHQDHINVSKSTITAARYIDNIYFYEPLMPSGRGVIPFKPQLYIDISEFIKDKIKALKCHKSQYSKPQYGERWVNAVIARSLLRGFECGTKYAEAFEIVRQKL